MHWLIEAPVREPETSGEQQSVAPCVPCPASLAAPVSNRGTKPAVRNNRCRRRRRRDLQTNVVQTRTTDAQGVYQIFALPPTVDYEVYANFKGTTSEKRTISGFMNRQDNVMNFQLAVALIDNTPAGILDEDREHAAEF